MKDSPLSKFRFLLFLVLLLLFIVPGSQLRAQTNTEVQQAIARLDSGDVSAVRQQLPTLITKYQNDAGVVYLQGRLATNGNEAKQYYQSIVSNFPKSEWADEALYHLYQYHYAMGLYKTANAELQQLAKDYPNSPYVKSIPLAGVPKVDKPLTNTTPKIPQSTVDTSHTKHSSQSKPTLPVSQEKYTLQVGAFSTSANAENLKSSFEQKGYRVEIANKVQNGKSLYKVWVGSYKTREEAEKAAKDMKSKFRLSSMVIER